MSKGFGSTMYLYNNLGFLVLCQEKVQIKCTQFSLCLAKLNLLFLSHYLLDFSDILPYIGLGLNTRTGCVYTYCIVKCFYVFKNQLICMCIITDFKPINPFPLQECMKGFYTGIIPWICFL